MIMGWLGLVLERTEGVVAVAAALVLARPGRSCETRYVTIVSHWPVTVLQQEPVM